MITKDKLGSNLKELKKILPEKPNSHTSVYPKTIKEALRLYCPQSTVHKVQLCTLSLNEEYWPLPLWFNPDKIKVGFFNKLYYRKRTIRDFDFFLVLLMNHDFRKIPYDQIVVEAFDANSKHAFKQLLQNPMLNNKGLIIKSIINTYKIRDWVACISTLFPLIDFVARRLLKTTNLSTSVSKIFKLFEENGFSLEKVDHLMPHFAFIRSHQPSELFASKERQNWFEEISKRDFGLIGPALSSFLRFANFYYANYKEEKNESVFNRHAILHGSTHDFGTKENAVKLLTFLILFLELEPVFEILLAE